MLLCRFPSANAELLLQEIDGDALRVTEALLGVRGWA